MTFPVNRAYRAEVRDTISAILADRVPAVGRRVYRARIWPVSGERKPALLVYGYAEVKQKKNADLWRHEYDVSCNMVVKVLCEGPSTLTSAQRLEAECEAIAEDVERVILSAPELWGSDGIPEKLPTITTVLKAEQKDRSAEMEALMQFELRWSEVFEMAEPDTSECAEVTFTPRATLIPTA